VNAPKERPFKKFFCDRPEVFLLPPAALKVWLYHYSREGSVRESWPGVDTLCEKLDMDRHSVCKWRGWLITNGWLEKIGERQGSGKFSVPVFKVTRGSIPARNKDGRSSNRVRKLNTRLTGAKTLHADRCENFALEVDSKKQVDKETEATASLSADPHLQMVWNYYRQEIADHTFYTFTPQRKKMGAARYAEALCIAGGDIAGAVTLMKCAIEAMRDSAWHNGKNDAGKKYNGWENIFGTAERFQNWLKQAQEA